MFSVHRCVINNFFARFIMDQLLDILNEINSDVDYEVCDTLIDDGIFSSFDIVSLVGELNDAFDIDITPVEYRPGRRRNAQNTSPYIPSPGPQ